VIVKVSKRGAATASLFRSSSSLIREQKAKLSTNKKSKNLKYKDSSQQTYESKASKISTSEVLGAEGSLGASL
jgi:hypothetical protein